MHVSISNGNNKMGSIKSVSLPSIYTCRRDCTCQSKCYAHKLERLRPSVRKAYENNLGILLKDPELYWREVEGAIMMSRFFRFHVSGDIPHGDYFAKMVEVAARNPQKAKYELSCPNCSWNNRYYRMSKSVAELISNSKSKRYYCPCCGSSPLKLKVN